MPHTLENILLSKKSRVTIRHYREMEQNRDRLSVARFVEERLLERYIEPLDAVPKPQKHGFLMMAACCLLIETLESFHWGWDDTNRKLTRDRIADPCKPLDPARNRVSASEIAFCYFFHRENAFAPLRPHARAFYDHVRCAILHQGETTGGWRITRLRDAELFDEPERTVNAYKFLRAVRDAVRRYCRTLETADWDDQIWMNFRNKMQAIIRNCET